MASVLTRRESESVLIVDITVTVIKFNNRVTTVSIYNPRFGYNIKTNMENNLFYSVDESVFIKFKPTNNGKIIKMIIEAPKDINIARTELLY